MDLLELVVEKFPILLPKCVPELLELCWAANKDDKIQIRVLRIVAR